MAEQTAAWQENKTMLERSRYMFENELATDVCFEFCSPEGVTTRVRAHKLFLVAGSPVFEAMFNGDVVQGDAERDTFHIRDVDAATFKELLRLLYFDDVY